MEVHPDISDEERKMNIESFFNVLYSAGAYPNYRYCIYDKETDKVTLYFNEE